MSERNPSMTAVGFAAFAGAMLVVAGIFQAMDGLIALFNDDFYVVGKEYIFQFDVTSWGWIHLILGIVLVASGIGIFSGNVLARTVGVIVAGLSMIANFAWLPYQPWWSVIIIALNFAVIWALTLHGRDIALDS